jgi:hypothetical protein
MQHQVSGELPLPKKYFTVDYTIAELEQTLDPAKFVRIQKLGF